MDFKRDQDSTKKKCHFGHACLFLRMHMSALPSNPFAAEALSSHLPTCRPWRRACRGAGSSRKRRRNEKSLHFPVTCFSGTKPCGLQEQTPWKETPPGHRALLVFIRSVVQRLLTLGCVARKAKGKLLSFFFLGQLGSEGTWRQKPAECELNAVERVSVIGEILR